MFRKVLIANRGAIARRVVRACHELGVQSAVVYSEADAQAHYLAEASEALALAGHKAEDTYLNIGALQAAITQSGADAVHPGYGFLAESAAFAEAVAQAGATFLGPDPELLRKLGDKVAARALFAQQGFPTFSGSDPLPDLAVARQVADSLGFPLMLKPVAGGGGIGMRVLHDADALADSFEVCRTLAQQSCGDPSLYFERFIERPRHVELQLLGDAHGGAVALFERDCSVQRRHQKLVEEAPAPGIERSEVDALGAQAVSVLNGLGYSGVATLETLRREDGEWGFLEINPRIQVEHGVTEAVTGMDLVGWQMRVAAGERVPGPPALQGHSLEVRVYAENPLTGFPDTGRLTAYRPPRMHGVRVETGYQEGQSVTPYYDALLAKVITWGTTREQAIGRARIGLRGFEVRGVRTNIATLERVLGDPAFLAGQVHTGFLAEMGTSA